MVKIIKAIKAEARGAKATQQGRLGTMIDYWCLLGPIGKTWLPSALGSNGLFAWSRSVDWSVARNVHERKSLTPWV